jgi:hypothetical protein
MRKIPNKPTGTGARWFRKKSKLFYLDEVFISFLVLFTHQKSWWILGILLGISYDLTKKNFEISTNLIGEKFAPSWSRTQQPK